MILNFDRRRLFILAAVGVFLFLAAGLYHAPTYVPKEVTRMKTSVSTWLKGTEPSLEDELYKDSPHFSVPKKPTEEVPKLAHGQKTTLESIDLTETFQEPGLHSPVQEQAAGTSVVHVVSSAVASHTTSAAVEASSESHTVNVPPSAELATNADYGMSLPGFSHDPTHSATYAAQTTLATHTKSVVPTQFPQKDEVWKLLEDE